MRTQKCTVFLESERGARGESENFFFRKKKFSPFPRVLNSSTDLVGSVVAGEADVLVEVGEAFVAQGGGLFIQEF